MSQEQLEILKMVADKVITAEEGERLLRALGEGRAEEGRHRPGRHGFRRWGEFFADVGGLVQDTVEDAIGELGVDFWQEDESLKESALVDGRASLPEGTRLVVRQKPGLGCGPGRGSDMEATGVGGDQLVVEARGAVRLYRGEKRAVLSVGCVPVKLQVPASVGSLKLVSMGGDVTARALGCPADLKTAGGRIRVESATREFQARTMGGDIELELAPGLSGDSRAVTMGGQVEARLREGVKASLRVLAMGDIEVDPALGAVRREDKERPGRAVYDVGGAPAEPATSVRLKTLGGSIRLKKA